MGAAWASRCTECGACCIPPARLWLVVGRNCRIRGLAPAARPGPAAEAEAPAGAPPPSPRLPPVALTGRAPDGVLGGWSEAVRATP